MWSQALSLLEDAERMQRQFFHQGAQGATWEPPVDVYQSGTDVWIFLAVPGVPADHVEAVMDGSTLVVRGERPLPKVAQGAAIRRLEIPYGRFERRIGLASGTYQVLQRVFDNGCLVIGLRQLG
jgi:HSP20 family molecular chaperone IbpA